MNCNAIPLDGSAGISHQEIIGGKGIPLGGKIRQLLVFARCNANSKTKENLVNTI